VEACLFRIPLEYPNKKPALPTKPATISIIQVQSCNALWRMMTMMMIANGFGTSTGPDAPRP